MRLKTGKSHGVPTLVDKDSQATKDWRAGKSVSPREEPFNWLSSAKWLALKPRTQARQNGLSRLCLNIYTL